MSSSIVFDRKVGSETDCKELEYISFLHQSSIKARTDCSIRDEDIRVFLLSRYGIDVSMETVRETILHGLGGDDDLDLMELTSILMIPVLLKAGIVIDLTGPTSMRSAFQARNMKTIKSDFDVETATIDSSSNRSVLPNSVQPPPNRMIEFITQVILHDVTGSSSPKPLTVNLIKQILTSYGENDLAKDDKLINEMLGCVKTNNDTVIMFDEKTFVQCLTSDIKHYDIENEARTMISTEEFLPRQVHVGDRLENTIRKTYQNVFGINKENDNMTKTKSDIPWKRNFTAPAIDITAGTFRSKLLFSLLWAITILNFGINYLDHFGVVVPIINCPEYDYGTGWIGNADIFGCTLTSTIARWITTFFFVGLLGLVFTGTGSIGNSIRSRRWYTPLLGCLPFVFFLLYRYVNVREELRALTYMVLFLSCICIVLHLLHVLAIILPEDFVSKREWLQRLLTPGFQKAELLGKQASAKKLNNMISNALLLLNQGKLENSIQDTYHAMAINSYSLAGTWKTEQIGGTRWTWMNIFNETLFSGEGVWLSVRVIASNIGQCVVCLFIAWAGTRYIKILLDNYDNSDKSTIYNYTSMFINQTVDQQLVNDTVTNFLMTSGSFLSKLYDSGNLQINCTSATTVFNDSQLSVCADGDIDCLGFGNADSLCLLFNNSTLTNIDTFRALNSSGFDVEGLTMETQASLLQASIATIDSLYPNEKYMISIPLGVALGVAVLTSVFLALSYVPSLTSTVLKLRCGLIPTMHYQNQIRYREEPQTVAMLTGSLFWGCLVSSIFTGFLCGLVVFFFLWQGTTYYAQRFFALTIAFSFIAIINFLLGVPFQRRVYSGFYRKRPATANIGMLALEWANFLVTSAVIGVRMVALTVMALFSVGRIYKPVLADGLGVFGPIELDYFPTIALRELLAHEAHRHPFIELLGLIYIMKLKHGDDFATRAGYGWRLIFVHALMPWLAKYRIGKDVRIMPKKLSAGYSQDEALQFVSIRRPLQNKNSIQQDDFVNDKDVPIVNNYYDSVQVLSKFDERILKLQNALKKVEIAKEKFELSDTNDNVYISITGTDQDYVEL